MTTSRRVPTVQQHNMRATCTRTHARTRALTHHHTCTRYADMLHARMRVDSIMLLPSATERWLCEFATRESETVFAGNKTEMGRARVAAARRKRYYYYRATAVAVAANQTAMRFPSAE